MNNSILHQAPEIEVSGHHIKKQLIITLKNVLRGRFYLWYPDITDHGLSSDLNLEGQLHFLFNDPVDANIAFNIRSACQTWNRMERIDRLTVLDAFSVLFQEALKDLSAVQRTLIFCQIFINEFIHVLTSH